MTVRIEQACSLHPNERFIHALFAAVAIGVAALVLPAFSATSEAPAGSAASNTAATADGYPIAIGHALGTTEIPAKLERVAKVNWANREVALALDVVHLGIAAANFGEDAGDDLLTRAKKSLTRSEQRPRYSPTRLTASILKP